MSEHVRLRSQLWSNSAGQLAGTIVARLSRAAAILACARFLGPSPFGELATGLAAYELLRVLSEAGLDTRLIRHVAQNATEDFTETVRTIALKIALAIPLIGAGTLLTRAVLGWQGSVVVLGLSVGLLGIATSGSVQATATARLDARALIPYQAIAGLVYFTIVTAVAARLRTPISAALGMGLADLLGSMAFLLYLRRTIRGERAGREWSLPRWKWLRESWPVAAVNILATTYARLGVWFLAVQWGTSSVAQYGVSYRVIEVFLIASAAVGSSAFAVTARLEKSGPEGASEGLLIHIVGRVVWVLVLLVATVITAASFLSDLIGADYAPAAEVTRILACALPPMFLNGLLTAHLYGRGRYRTVLQIAALNLVLNIGLLIVLVPAWGPRGVAVAVLTTEAVNTALQARAAGLSPRSLPFLTAVFSLSLGLLLFFF
jgi:O-antigen/teichoic acid export membrane protein